MASRPRPTTLPLLPFAEAEYDRFDGGVRDEERLKVEFTQMVDASSQLTAGERAKALGAYYTDSQVADFLVWWAVRQPTDTVLDPSFGGGVFLRSAGKRIRDLRGAPRAQVFGVELADDVHSEISCLLQREFEIDPEHVILSDFFEVLPHRLRQFDVVVGNPPFIRYQRFAGDVRRRALTRAAEGGPETERTD